MPVGTISYTPESQEAYSERKENEKKRYMCRSDNPFYFIPTDEQFDGIAPETVTRLIYLNTFVGYDNNRLMLTERTPMKRKDLSSVLGLSKATISRFWKEVYSAYIIEKDGGLIFSNSDVFVRGRISSRKDHILYQKVYIDGVRKLYESTDKNNHRQLGYLFKLLPFINIEYNLLCYNPLETELDKVELVSLADFCSLIDYDITHLSRLLSVYKSAHFDVNGHRERFCAIIYDGLDRSNAKICINPHILYSGTNYNQVEVLGAFCEE